MTTTTAQQPVRVVGRYALYEEIASGGMATVHFGRLLGPVGFSRTVAIKRLHPQFARDPEFVSMFLDEARLAARIRHPNVVPTLDVVATSGELFLVMDYVQGESLSRLIRHARDRGTQIHPRAVASIMSGVLNGLHAAHEARNERGEPLDIVHRDISPQNILVGTDGIARVLDFGVAKAGGRIQTTRDGQLKGKLAYMAPEQLEGKVSRRVDIYAASVVLWEALTGQRLFHGDSEAVILGKILSGDIPPPSKFIPAGVESLSLATLDEVVLRGLSRDPAKRFATAREMSVAVEKALPLAPIGEVGEWLETAARDALQRRANKIAEIESTSSSLSVNASQIAAQLRSEPPSPAEVTRTDAVKSIPHPGASGSTGDTSELSAIRPPDRGRSGWLAFAGMAAIALAVGGVVTLFAGPPQKGDSSTHASSGSATAPPPSGTASVAAFEGLDLSASGSPSASISAAPVSSASAPLVKATAPVAKPTARPIVHPTTKATVEKKPAGCDVPFTIDPVTGRKKYKIECLGGTN